MAMESFSISEEDGYEEAKQPVPTLSFSFTISENLSSSVFRSFSQLSTLGESSHVDIPMASGPDQRLFMIGDDEENKVGGGLITELRDPVVKSMAVTKEFESLDQIEEEEDVERELEEVERKQREEVDKLKRELTS